MSGSARAGAGEEGDRRGGRGKGKGGRKRMGGASVAKVSEGLAQKGSLSRARATDDSTPVVRRTEDTGARGVAMSEAAGPTAAPKTADTLMVSSTPVARPAKS